MQPRSSTRQSRSKVGVERLASSFLAVLLGSTLGCSDTSAPASSASTSAPVASASASASARPSSGLVPSGVEGPPATGELARLPRGGSLYATVRTEMLDVLARVIPQTAGIAEAIAPAGKGRKLSAALAEMGVDPSRPILTAAFTRGFDLTKKLLTDAQPARAKPLEGIDNIGSFIRYELPLVEGANPTKLLPLLQAVGGPDRKVVECPSGPGCSDVGGTGLVGLAADEFGGASLRVVDGWARIDSVSPFGDGKGVTERALRAFAAEPLGGPAPSRCTRVDATAQAAVCVDALRMSEGYAAERHAIAISGVSYNVDLPVEDRKQLLDRGQTEAAFLAALGSPARVILDDGTLLFSGPAAKPHMVMSWSLTDASRPGIEAALPTPLCGQGPAFIDTALGKLIPAFGEPGAGLPDLAAKSKQFERVDPLQLSLLWARTWPNFAGPMKQKLSRSLRPLLGAGKACIRIEGGRLEFDADAMPSR